METNHNFLQTGGQPVSDRMRELLARAAQDHVYEQRSVGQVLDEIRQRLEGMEWLLREVRERELGGLTGQLETVREQVDELTAKPPAWAERLAEHVDSVGEKVKPVGELPALWADVGVIAENVDEGLSRVQTVMESAQHIADAGARTAQRMDDMAKRLDKLQGNMEAASVRFNRLDKALAELGHRAERLEHSIGGATDRVELSLSEMAERITQGLGALDGRVEGIGGRLDGLDGRLEGLSGALQGIDDRIGSVGEAIGRLPTVLEVGELHRRLTELVQRPVIDHGDRFDALEKRLVEAVDPLLDELRARPDRDEVKAAMSHLAETAYGDVAQRMDEFARRADSVHDDVRRRIESVHEEVARRVDIALDGFGKHVGGIQDDVTRRVDGARHEFATRVDDVRDEVAKRVDGVRDELAKRAEAAASGVGDRVEGMREDFGRRVDSVRTEVGAQMTAAHEDVLKRLATLEETMLTLAEALLRPRRDGQD